MYKMKQSLYKKITEYFDISQISKENGFELKKKINSNKKLIIRLDKIENKYFTLLDFIFIDNKLSEPKTYVEFNVKIWNNKMAEVIKYKKAKLSEYQDIYISRHGFEVANKILQNEANQDLAILLKNYF